MNAERMRRACELLERRERIKDVAFMLGYGHQRNFSTAFTKYHGYPPSLRRIAKEGARSKMEDGRWECGTRDAGRGTRDAGRGTRDAGRKDGAEGEEAS